MAITKENIIETAERLQAQGINPTQTNVREALGGGSFATIGPVLKAWRAAEQADHALAEVHIPESIADRLEQLQGALWQTAISEAERRLTAEREALKEAQERAISEVAEANEAVTTLEAEQEELKAGLSASADEVKKLQLELAEHKNRFASQRDEMTREISERTAKIESLTATITELRTALEKSERRCDSIETRLERREERYQEDINTISRNHKNELQAALAEHQAVLESEAKKIESLERRADELNEARLHALARAASAENTLENYRIDSGKALEESRMAAAKLREQLDAAQQEAAELRGKLKALSQNEKKA